MTDLLAAAHQQLTALGVRVTRGWPQGIVGLPSIVLKEAENAVAADGGTHLALDIAVRAASPEEADDLARRADAALPYARTACKDGAEKDGSCFMKHLRYEHRLPAPDAPPEGIALTVRGTAHVGRVLRRERRRALLDVGVLSDPAPRLAPGRLTRHTLLVQLPGAALADMEATFAAADALPLPGGGQALIEALTLKGAVLEVLLHETL